MQTAIDAFEASMLRMRALHALHGSFAKQVTAAVDLTDILRAEVVLAVSALDYFVHELVRLGMLESWSGSRARTDAFLRFQLPLSIVGTLFFKTTGRQALDVEIRSRHGYIPFQHPDKIADAVRLFSNVKLWEEVGKKLGLSGGSVKSSLILILDRRNKIAHEADLDPSYPGQRWPIDIQLVEGIFDTLEKIARAIFDLSR